MAHKCYISFKTEDIAYKEAIQNDDRVDMIDKSLNEPINSNDEDYIMRKIREDYLSDSTVTIFLIGKHSAEYLGYQEQQFIKRELQSSLYNGSGNSRNGILGIVLPDIDEAIFKGESAFECSVCGQRHNIVQINDQTVIKEFSYNYYLPTDKCAWSEDDRYCVLVSWGDFLDDPNRYIDMAFDKRSDPIASKVKVRP